MQDGTYSTPDYPQETSSPRGNAFAANCATRQLLDRIADKWSVLVLLILGEGDIRFGGLKRRIEGISQKMLSQTLRSLERDGLVTREFTPTMPVMVTYSVTPLGRELLSALRSMIDWAEMSMVKVVAAQHSYDARS